MAIVNSTFVSNRAFVPLPSSPNETRKAYGGAIFSTEPPRILGSIFLNNMPRSFHLGTITRFDFGLYKVEFRSPTDAPTVIDRGANIANDDAFTASTSMNSTDAKVGPMRRPFTNHVIFPLQPDSPAIGLAAGLIGPSIDQMGFARRKQDAGAAAWQGEAPMLHIAKEDGELLLRVFDPSYSFHAIDRSLDLRTWTSLPFFDYSGKTIEPTRTEFFRLR